MDINYEIVQYYIYKRLIKKKLRNSELEDCNRLNMSVEKYMIVKNYATEVQALPALGDFYNANEICYQKLNSIYIGCGEIKTGTGGGDITLVNAEFAPVKTVEYKQRLKKSDYSVKEALMALK